VVISRPSSQPPAAVAGRAARGALAAALALVALTQLAAEETQRLPTPPGDPPRTAQSQEPYVGPPATIDGPQRLPPPEIEIRAEEIPPGIVPEDYVPLPGSPIEGELDDEIYLEGPHKISDHKNGFFQKLSLSAAWIGNANNPNDLGVTEVETFLTVALPAPIVEWPLLITPGYNMIFLDGPSVTDLPPRLNTAYLDFMWLPTIVHRWTLLLSVAPSVFTDFQSSDPDMFRVTGKALVLYDWFPGRLKAIGGLLYLGRDDVTILPAGGVIWTPSDWTRFELLFPKPKLAVRFNVGLGYEDWFYGTAEFGGNTWSIERLSGLPDKVTYLDYRAVFGIERKLDGGAGYRLEGGYVFGREITFASGLGDFNPQDSFILRGGITY
jgi:hypothetical protein